jgi:hypothetical protein
MWPGGAIPIPITAPGVAGGSTLTCRVARRPATPPPAIDPAKRRDYGDIGRTAGGLWAWRRRAVGVAPAADEEHFDDTLQTQMQRSEVAGGDHHVDIPRSRHEAPRLVAVAVEVTEREQPQGLQYSHRE